jgi:hypothetical protein
MPPSTTNITIPSSLPPAFFRRRLATAINHLTTKTIATKPRPQAQIGRPPIVSFKIELPAEVVETLWLDPLAVPDEEPELVLAYMPAVVWSVDPLVSARMLAVADSSPALGSLAASAAAQPIARGSSAMGL